MLNTNVVDSDALYYGMPRNSLLSFLSGPPARVLEIGCGSGVMLDLLKKAGASYVCGLELNAVVAEQARARPTIIDEIFVGDAEQGLSKFSPGSFDLIVASHVLEHLVDPWSVTKQIYTLLSPGGMFVGAVPNVRHLSVLLPLLLRGEWTYQPTGIMDWTHIRFFTKSGLVEMLEGSGFNSIDIKPEIGGGKSKFLDVCSLGTFRNFAAYAYNFSGTKEVSAPSSPR